jgi:diguanylate cyclase
MNKKEKFSEEETQEMQQHAVVGYRILNIFDATLDLAEVVYSHHERWDGKGYPKGLKGREIPRLSRVLSVAESYDRIIHRTYHEKISEEDAKQILKDCAGTQFDPEIVELFINQGIQQRLD